MAHDDPDYIQQDLHWVRGRLNDAQIDRQRAERDARDAERNSSASHGGGFGTIPPAQPVRGSRPELSFSPTFPPSALSRRGGFGRGTGAGGGTVEGTGPKESKTFWDRVASFLVFIVFAPVALVLLIFLVLTILLMFYR